MAEDAREKTENMRRRGERAGNYARKKREREPIKRNDTVMVH